MPKTKNRKINRFTHRIPHGINQRGGDGENKGDLMDKFKNKYRIESNRWAKWDYSDQAAYFITICTKIGSIILANAKMES
ncbi:MAG: hypothetical protein UZ09_BCD002001015 [Bacteroidetes bacterium OLB9]|nr:MAG: hypothetical protein UZ09_BCD002001015 [Bacteroidetes bacterium OLB9]